MIFKAERGDIGFSTASIQQKVVESEQSNVQNNADTVEL
jgi:hypothetical protein